MSLNLTELTAYVDEQREPLIGKAVLGAKSAKLLTLQTGVKGKAALNLVEHEVEFGDGSDCGWDEAGETKLSQREIEVGMIKINKAFCDKKLAKYWTGYKVKVAAGQKSLPFEEDFVQGQLDAIATALETAIWQGDTDSVDENLNKFDGLIEIIDNASGVISAVNTGLTDITEANVITVIDNIFRELPASLLDKDNVVIMAGVDTFRKYVIALRSANLYHYTYDMDKGMELVIPGTQIKLIGVNGLNGTDRLFAFQTSNVFYGTDLENDEEKFELWYSKDNREFRMAVEFNAGVQIAFPDEIVEFTKE